jgi:hypothetical protein
MLLKHQRTGLASPDPFILRLPCKPLFVFLHSYENKFSTSSGKQKPDDISSGFVGLAVRTGLEPATLGVTGRYSNQLNYRTIYCAAKLI